MGNVNDPDFRYSRKGVSDWGTVTLSPTKGLSEKVKNWIETAREFVPSKPDDEGEVEEEN